ncbi:antibiotic biosynthesis monooxygenase [Emcibacter nanhaiensis]|uniref:Antibiotic biosynthesis monooxygenase n=1 Tax=Emcibacter nanhaiensis TaxID=1505037 RepID=A0A501PTL3_9PROT|nr:antibiotic biosynthesis monooxygenase [Emcibacter nanhaiensis]TPD63106.1 antibiotic biosynthesis monooxygenase [Emcibacter nanhaiensis]
MFAQAVNTSEFCPAAEDNEPVTVTIARKVRPGKEVAYEQWAKDISAAARRFCGHQSLSILRPSPATGGKYVFMLHFDTREHERAWEDSAVRAEYLQKLEDDGLVEGETEINLASGFEFWFPMAEVPSAAPPPRWKMVTLVIPTVILLVMLVNYLFHPIYANWPGELRLVVQCIFQVLLMTYVIMPRLISLFRFWLYPQKVGGKD